MLPRLELIEDQMQKWRYRFPDLMASDEADKAVTAIELQEQFEAFKEADRRRIDEIRAVISAVAERVSVEPEVKDRLTSELDRASTTLNDLVAEIQRVVHTRSASLSNYRRTEAYCS